MSKDFKKYGPVAKRYRVRLAKAFLSKENLGKEMLLERGRLRVRIPAGP